MVNIRNLFSLILILACGAQAQPITNGGWEAGMTGWTTTVKPGVQAAVTTIIERRHTGGNALEVVISGSGIRDSLVRLTSDAYAWDTSRTYMVRFWAIAKDRAALLDLRIGDGATARKYHYEIYDSDGLWHRYQLLFKPAFTQGAITLQFGSPSTYWLDDVEVIDDRDTVLDLKTQFMWQSAHVGYGWISGDNDVSVPLPDGRIAWILNDSFIGILNDQSNVLKEVKMITNLIIMEERKAPPVMRTVFAGTVAEPKALFPTTAFTLYWISDAMVVGNKLQILLQEWNWAYKFTGSAYVGTMTLPDLKVESMVKTAYKGTDIPNGMLQEKDWTYVYSEDRSDTTMRYTRVARVPAGLITEASPWQYLAKDGTWSADFAKAGRMLEGAQIASAVKLGDSNYVFSGVRYLTNDLTVWFSKTPYGPWSAPYLVYRAPEEAGILPYLGHIHKGTRKDGVFTLSYSLFPNKGGWFQQLSDRGCYLPQYVKANLERLSPFTKKPPTFMKRERGRVAGMKARAAGYSLTGRRVEGVR